MLTEQIKKDLILAQKEKQEKAVSCLRMLLASIVNKEKDKRLALSEKEPNLNEEELAVKSKLNDEETKGAVVSEVKKRRDSIISFEKGGRQDLIENEKAELELLKKYMPAELSQEEIRNIVKEAIAQGARDIGSTMKEVIPRTKGRADGNLVSKIVREELGIDKNQ